MKAILYALGAALFLAMMSIVGNMNAEDKKAERDRYCEMLEIWEETDGEYGWPPYKGECNNE